MKRKTHKKQKTEKEMKQRRMVGAKDYTYCTERREKGGGTGLNERCLDIIYSHY